MEDVKRFQSINEYTFISQEPLLGEDEDENDMAGDGQQQGQPQPTPQDQQQPGPVPPAPQAPTTDDGGQPPVPPADGAPVPTPDAEGALPAPTGGENGGDDFPPMNADAGSSEEGDSEGDADKASEEGEITIDIDDLVKSQDETSTKLDAMGNEMSTLIKVMGMLGQALDMQNKQIADIGAEIKKNNPSEEEILNIRSQSGAPFNEQPKDFWQNKQAQNPHYNVMMDNTVSPADEQDAAQKDQKLDITVDDVRNINPREVSASIDEPFELEDFLKF